MKHFTKTLLIFAFTLASISAFADDDYEMPDVATIKTRIAVLHPDFAEHLKHVYQIAGKKITPIALVAALGLDIHDYEQSQQGFGAQYNVDAVYFLRDVFARKICVDCPIALKELEELQMDHGKPALTKAVMITMPKEDELKARLGSLAGLFRIDNILSLAGKEIEVMEFAAALFKDFYALAKKAEDNVFVQRSATAVFMLRDKFLTDLIEGEDEAIAKLKEMGVFREEKK